MLAALEASELTDSAFARAMGIGLHRVTYWRTRLAGETGAADGPGFVAVRVVSDDANAKGIAEEQRVEVQLANGRRLAFTGVWTAASIAPWLRALEADRC